MNDLEDLGGFEPHRYLSAPWRMRYLSKSQVIPGCVFCEKLASVDDIENLVLWRGDSISVLMNLFPYSTGHMMLLPYEHIASPELLEDASIMTEIATEIPLAMRALRKVLGCQGFNTGMNTGGAAGAGIADHMHMHVVPRWNGDANFMPVIGNVTVMPEELSVTYAKLRAELIVEHDRHWAPSALVLSADHSKVFLLDKNGGMLPSTLTNDEHSIVRSMGSELTGIGIEAAVVGWTGDSAVVWQASKESIPAQGRWVAIPELPATIAALAAEALQRLGASGT
jgi:ATP adenylyltransferase